MEVFEKLYDEHENVNVRFVGFTTEEVRYDFGIIHTNMFFGKPLVVCMQTGRSALLDANDLQNHEYLQKVFRIHSLKEAKDLSLFFEESLPSILASEQYD
ncbi:DUF3055 domain-containing protein [Fictibacillus sp. WQ 8-8]|uniref:DUF3055 domain-containing protein n=1 Tax=Fictibacillus marinisediminis TaxID=2878389 RepID=A0A9X2BCS5_9BACL|nr:MULTISPECIES: DUF3055 domain-containing protein [unclassified Fictibacillus]MCK6256856.1 DUF3055 domain-containing protein [Fictibacillus marinisediminis]MCQ6265635.1 DUF3055 domain-containing protein [Fictibacillus sp. WQ 8-8]MED2973483.1 DUF3055 domain-containing protein [Fictibacillus sp. B-59209]UZJ77316.1 DUF3055 domain-containing protein [Fictibacillus sp. KU28468]